MIRNSIKYDNFKSKSQFVILDDDPTGCQTVHGIDTYFEWDKETIDKALDSEKDFFLLINSRAVSEKKAFEINSSIGKILSNYSKKSGRKIKIISRSDSTLRGHFFPETLTLQNECGPFDGLIVCPYFKEGNRFTINDTHYIKDNDELIPVNKTEFANDSVFGFENAHLPSWIEEKSRGQWKREDVVSITLKDIRFGASAVYEKIRNVKDFVPIVLNAEKDEDLEVIVQGIQKAENEGKTFLYRTAASFVKIRLGIDDKALFVPEKKEFGMVIAGSYVNKTTKQLDYLMEYAELKPIEINVDTILKNFKTYLSEKLTEIENSFERKQSVLIYTKRILYHTKGEEALNVGESIMEFFTSLVNELKIFPEFIIAKGGITSNEIARKGLRVKKAEVKGQIAPGIPIIQLREEAKIPGIDYVIFPGNVGDVKTLTDVYKKFITNDN